MKLSVKIILYFLLAFNSIPLLGQTCTNYHTDHCRWADISFLYSRQSRSALFKPGMTSEFNIIVYAGEEYYISHDGHKKLGKIRLRLKEANDEKTILYDNAQFKYEEYFYFKNTTTRNLIVEITTIKPEKSPLDNDKYCLGILMLFKNDIPIEDTDSKIGF